MITVDDFNTTPGTPVQDSRSFRSSSNSTVIVSAKTVVCFVACMFLLYCLAVGTGIFLLYNSSKDITRATQIAADSYDIVRNILKSVQNMSEDMKINFQMQAVHISSLKGNL
jgi:hypothetical protein